MKEHVTLTQQEHGRLQVLNNLLAGYMTTEQAATLMGVSTRHTRRILAAYRRREQPHWLTAKEAADLPTLHRRGWLM